MKHLSRAIQIAELISQDEILVIYGPRRAGKTTLVQEYLQNSPLKSITRSGEESSLEYDLGSRDITKIKNIATGNDILFIDEAQDAKSIGEGLKILIDNRKDVFIIVTGSSSFDLAYKIGEPLVGRKRVITLYPLGVYELLLSYTAAEVIQMRDTLLVYGGYPRVVIEESVIRKQELLQELINSYLLKDIFETDSVRSPRKLIDLLRLLAYAIGQPISLSSLANELDLDIKTIDRYLDLLQKTFVLHKVQAFSRNLSNTIKQKTKYYFWDVGIRNALIGNFNDPAMRDDIGGLWENFCVMERIKRNSYARDRLPNYYFYRDYAGKEIDLIEEYNGYTAFECKWSPTAKVRVSMDWLAQYPDARIHAIHRDNFLEYLK